MPDPKEELGIEFVNKQISDYYSTAKYIAPDRMSEREFGVGNFETKIARRHISFKSENELRNYLSGNSVPYVSCSAAYYKYPDGRPMENKGWLGSELVFDLDSTDMDLVCQRAHGRSWVCKNCLNSVKGETIKLIYDFLIPDFGFSESDIQVNFSGSRGYHVHIKKESVLQLDAASRREISNYISGIGMDFQEFFPTAGQRGMMLSGPRPSDKGWKGKIARNFLSNLNAGIDSLSSMGIDRTMATKLYRKKSLIEMGIRNGNWDMVYIKNKADFWKGIIDRQAVSQSDKIDKNVTNDPSHLIRLPNTIHGGTGLLAKRLGDAKDLYRFDPMKDAIAFKKGQVRISANTNFEIVMAGQRYGPYGGEINVPMYVAMYLFLKGNARLLREV
ncbi:MAG: DNA primase catalytic subunit PriS [Candidatus Micrarchaeota archaeon]|nr:DNA primase catalytic subunit PriS [Candidatus Micrarchaeota archaeon]MDE1834104.1 DNA primase catalytic subunit PriS [Candidatus Micrarchaeota archaeon]MDE1859344.1 DNA primase catalytic subunit PriS [Candidatus Micrarchaeota archaeon]